jgi:ATP-dependent helicase/nuclease subunit B
MLKILIGEAKTGKSYRVYEELIAAVQAGRGHECMLIVPEQFTLEAEKQLLEQGALNGFVGLEVLSLKRLTHFVFDELGSPRETVITALGQMMLLKQIFETEKQSLTYYRRAFDKRGMLERCFEFIEELKQNRIEPHMMAEAVDAVHNDPLLSAKLADLAFIFNAYEAAKTSQYFDGADVYEHLLTKLPQSQKLRQKQIWIDGFDSFTVQELAVIEALCQTAKHVTVTLTALPDAALETFAHTQSVLQRLTHFEGVPVQIERMTNVRMHDDLRHFSLHAMVYPIIPYKGSAAHIAIHSAQSQASEVVWIAETLLKHMRTGQYNWRDFSVLTNDLDGYQMTIHRIFEQYGIPHFIDVKRRILNHPVVHFMTNIFEAFQMNFRQDTVIKLLKTGFFEWSATETALFEHYIIEHGIYGKRLFQPFEKAISEQYDLELLNALRRKLTEPLDQYRNHLKNAETVRQQLKLLFELMQQLAIPEKIQQAVQIFTEKGNMEQAQIFAQVWNAVINVFEQLDSLIGSEVMTSSALWERLEVGLENVEIGLLPLSEQHVLIGSLDRSRAHPVAIQFLVGINDGVLPEAGAEQQLLQEHEKQRVNDIGLRWLSDQQMFIQKESFNIYQALTRPSEKLYLSYALSDKKGAALRPSYLIAKFKSLLPLCDQHLEPYGHLKTAENIATPEGTYGVLAEQMRLHLDGQKIDEVWYEVMAWYRHHEPIIADRLLEAATHHHHVQKLAESEVSLLYERPIKSSVSGLEQYVACPFKYFVDQGLKPKRVKPFEITYPDVGILFHKALERFGKTVYDQKLIWEQLSQAQCDQMIDAIIGEMVSAEIYQSKFQYKALIRKLGRVAKRAVWTLTTQLKQGTFKPVAFELAFTDAAFGVPPIVIELSNQEKIMLRGVVDRVDLLDEDGVQYIKIIDYKSGAKQLSLEDIYHGLQMQLCVYMYACLSNPSYFKTSALRPGGFYYYRIDDPLLDTVQEDLSTLEQTLLDKLKLDGISLDDERVLSALDMTIIERDTSSVVQVKRKKDGSYTKDSKVLNEIQFHALMTHVTSKISSIGDQILGGDIDIAPCRMKNGLSCDYCEFSGICQFEIKFDYADVRRLPKMSNDDVVQRIEVMYGGERDDEVDA